MPDHIPAEPFIIMCAPNGARRGKDEHANIPLSASELADCAVEIVEAGASMMHLHVRGADGGHSLSVARYKEAIKAIRARVGDGLVLQVTSEAVGIYSRDQQMAMVKELQPEAVSLGLRELCPDDSDEASTQDFFSWIADHRIFPQIILYNQEDTLRFERMRRAGVFACSTPFVLCVLGKVGNGGRGKPQYLHEFTSILSPCNVPWAACGFAENEHNLADNTARIGGHVRVGFENNLWRADGSLAESNAELVKHAYQSALKTGRPVATAAEVRRRFMQP